MKDFNGGLSEICGGLQVNYQLYNINLMVFKKTDQPKKPNRDEKPIKSIFKIMNFNRSGSVSVLVIKPTNQTRSTKKS
jgi:hypothetical protein